MLVLNSAGLNKKFETAHLRDTSFGVKNDGSYELSDFKTLVMVRIDGQVEARERYANAVSPNVGKGKGYVLSLIHI